MRPASLILALASLLTMGAAARAQWTVDCNSAITPNNATHSVIQMRAVGSEHAQCFTIADSLSIRIWEDACSQTPTWQYTFNAAERSANMKYVYASYQDFTGDGINEIFLLTYYYSPYRTALKILNIVNGATLLERRDTQLSCTAYPYNVADLNGDGELECPVQISNLSAGQTHTEIYHTGVSAPSGVGGTPLQPTGFSLEQNYPNPFNPTTRIEYGLAQAGPVTLEVFDLEGHKVITLASGYQLPGTHSVEWNGRDEHGMPLTSGSYFYQVSVNGKPSDTRKMILLR